MFDGYTYTLDKFIRLYIIYLLMVTTISSSIHIQLVKYVTSPLFIWLCLKNGTPNIPINLPVWGYTQYTQFSDTIIP